jgi:hypothetical protein
LLDALVGDVEFDDANARQLAPDHTCPPFASYVARIVEAVRAGLAAGPSVPPPAPESLARLSENDLP